MASERRTKVKHLVVDANAFIRNVNLQEIGENIYSLPNVVEEIRDSATRQRLQVLPYKLRLDRTPTTESLCAVTDFSKKTGDYPSLSATDLSILALTHFLEREVHGNVDHLSVTPKQNAPLINPKRSGELTLIGGVRMPVVSNGSELDKFVDRSEDVPETEDARREAEEECLLKRIENVDIEDSGAEMENSSDAEVDSGEEEEHDDEGWITTDNIQDIKRTMGFGGITSQDEDMPLVACITSDFSMQNVLIQMGLKCLSMDGMCIRRAQTYILRCFACFQRTSEMTRIFCKSCGNKGTLKKVAVEIDENGEMKMFINFKKPINQRGLRYSIPLFRGGKHSNNPVLNEYQPRPQNKLPKKALRKLNALDPDYAAQDSPFSAKDVQSRAAMLDVRHIGAVKPGLDRDPYMNRVRTGNKKKKNRL
ncbi:RNA-binding protein NOB1 [Galendromus occidentalis]|uniref:RNA-binding protein NOB1 n=1 Tax=Galendromus occidentalis TaxID=34638 RepID=A0AAJ6QYC2_9ACAR|nr:RNA-binding protein NOB1 [Galendromus occidentalis]